MNGRDKEGKMTSSVLEQVHSEPMARPVPRQRPMDRDGMPALLVEHLTKRFVVGRKKKPVVAVNDVSLRIPKG